MEANNLHYRIKNVTSWGEVLSDLLRMNITRMSLFPGLESFARTLGDNLEQAL